MTTTTTSNQTTEAQLPLTLQERLVVHIHKIVKGPKIKEFVKFAHKQIENHTDTSAEEMSVEKIAEFFSQKVIPNGMSLNTILDGFKSWSKGSSGFRRLSALDFSEGEKTAHVAINTTTGETGGMILKEIGENLETGRKISATAVNQLIDKLIPVGSDDAKLTWYKNMLKNNLIDREYSHAYFKKVDSAAIRAAGMFVEFIEAARGDDDVVTPAGVFAILTEKKLTAAMDDQDTQAELAFLEMLCGWANDIELADDDMWKEMVMDALVEDYNHNGSPTTLMHLDVPREYLNIMKTFQTLVSNLLVPPPKRGRPAKNK